MAADNLVQAAVKMLDDSIKKPIGYEWFSFQSTLKLRTTPIL
jgi:hypothetical protein